MSQVNSVKDLRNKHAKCLVQNRGQTTLLDVKGSSYDRPRATNGDPVFKINMRPLNSAVTSLESVLIPNSTSSGNIDRLLIADKQGDHYFYRNIPPSYATEVETLNSLKLRNASNIMMTDHTEVNYNELLQLEDDLKELRHKNEENEIQAI